MFVCYLLYCVRLILVYFSSSAKHLPSTYRLPTMYLSFPYNFWSIFPLFIFLTPSLHVPYIFPTYFEAVLFYFSSIHFRHNILMRLLCSKYDCFVYVNKKHYLCKVIVVHDICGKSLFANRESDQVIW